MRSSCAPGWSCSACTSRSPRCPLALVGLAIGLDEPLGFGLFLIAAAPPAALIPAYADVAEVPGGDLLVFVLIAYGLALVLTPALVYLAAGELVGLGPIALTLGAGLVAPAVLARVLHPQIARIPQRVRRGVVNSSVVVICFGLGGGLFEGLDSSDVTALTLGVVVAALVARSAVGGGRSPRGSRPRTSRPRRRSRSPSRTSRWRPPSAAPSPGPVAALPGLIAFPVEILYFLFLAQRRARRRAARRLPADRREHGKEPASSGRPPTGGGVGMAKAVTPSRSTAPAERTEARNTRPSRRATICRRWPTRTCRSPCRCARSSGRA